MAAATTLRMVSDPAPGGTGSGHTRTGGGNDPVLGMLIFIASEVMLFAGLLSAFLVARAGAPFWPPPNQPRLPVAMTAFNTIFLLISALTMWCAVRLLRHDRVRAARWLNATIVLGLAFFVLQGGEWVHLIRFGLTMRSSLYGAMFYLIVGIHALHLVVALGLLSVVAARLGRGRYEADFRGVVACWAYWSFVVALWPIIYAFIYCS